MSKVVHRFDILGVQMSAVNMKDACEVVENLIQKKSKGYVCVSPVSTIMECFDNPKLKEIVNRADLVTPDGMPSVWIGKRRGFKEMSRVYGPDLMLAICQLSADKGYKSFLYGATDDVLEKLQVNLKKRFPKLNICGKFAPPFRALTSEEDRNIIQEINKANPDCLWVGLGSPKQDIWISQHRAQLNVPVMFAVGAAFDFIAGSKPQAPKWMQQAGLEWLFRLCSEPTRLWRRYLIGNTLFVYYYIRESLKRKFS